MKRFAETIAKKSRSKLLDTVESRRNSSPSCYRDMRSIRIMDTTLIFILFESRCPRIRPVFRIALATRDKGRCNTSFMVWCNKVNERARSLALRFHAIDQRTRNNTMIVIPCTVTKELRYKKCWSRIYRLNRFDILTLISWKYF